MEDEVRELMGIEDGQAPEGHYKNSGCYSERLGTTGVF